MSALLCILALGFVLRLAFLSGYATDDMAHLCFVNFKRNQPSAFDNTPKDSVIPGILGYPMLSHRIISRFPRRMWKAAGKLLNIGYDLVLIVLTWVVARLAFPTAPNMPFSPADMAAFAVATSPCLLPITARIKSLGARTLGNVLVMGYLLSMWAAMAGNPLVFGPAAVLLGLVVIATSQFGIQAVVLSSPFIALFAWSWLPLAVVVTLLLALAAACKINCRVCRGLRGNVAHMVEHKRWYRRNAQQGTTAMWRNRFRDLLDLPRLWITNKDVFFGVLFRRNTYIIALYSFPLFWVAAAVAWQRRLSPAPGNLIDFCLAVVFAMTCIFFLTSTKRLSFLGQAERYFEYAVPFASIILAQQLATQGFSPRLALCIITWQITFTVANLAYTHFASIKSALTLESEDGVVKYLNDHSGMRILTIPMKLANYYSCMSDGGNAYYFKLLIHSKHGMSHRDKEMPWLEMPCKDLAYFHREYGIDTIIIQKSFLIKMEQEHHIDYDFSNYNVVYDDELYTVYKICTEQLDVAQSPDAQE